MTRLADTITVTRTSDGATTLTIDGEELPYETGSDPVSIDVEPGRPSGVRLTLLARHVRVNDDALADIPDRLLEHTHVEPAAAPSAEPVESAEPTEVAEDSGTVVDQRTGTVFPRCSQTCTLKALGNGKAVCNDEDCTPPKGVTPK